MFKLGRGDFFDKRLWGLELLVIFLLILGFTKFEFRYFLYFGKVITFMVV